MTDTPETKQHLPALRRKATTPMQMIDRALASGATPEVLDKLMGLQERYEANEARKAFDAAIAMARAEITPIVKGRTAEMELRTGGKASYNYEDMALIAEVIDPILAKHGLSYRHKSRTDGGQITVTCFLSHQGGHREEGATLSAAADTTGAKNNVQAVGSTSTYLQRYTLKLSVGLAASRDDDARKAPHDDPTIDADQYVELQGLLDKTRKTEDDLFQYLGLPPDANMHVLTLLQYRKAKYGMEKYLKDHEYLNKGPDHAPGK